MKNGVTFRCKIKGALPNFYTFEGKFMNMNIHNALGHKIESDGSVDKISMSHIA